MITAAKTNFQVEESLSALTKSGNLFAELFNDKNITVEIYKPNQEDLQAPHDRDELYMIISGSGNFRMNDEIVQFRTGDLLLVPKGVVHRFENFTKDFYDKRWHGQGTSNAYPSANIGGGTNYLPNSFFVESGSYFRIRNMQLGYTLSHSLTNQWKIKSLRVFVDAQNAFSFFKYTGFSPEVGGSPTNAGIDVNVYPLSATYRFGVNVSL